MFVYYFVHLNEPFAEVDARLDRIVASLDAIASDAYRAGEDLRARIGLGSGVLAKTVRINVGDPLRHQGETAIPISWHATGTPALFPRLDGELVIAAVGPDLTQLTLRGSYRTPLGPVGRALDRAVLHRVAEASVKGLVDRLAVSLQDRREPAGRWIGGEAPRQSVAPEWLPR